MRFLTVKLLAATALSLSLGACVPTTTLPGATTPAVVAPPLPDASKNAEHYAGVADDGFNVPTVPVEKVPADFQVQTVDYASTEAVGSVVIAPAEKHLYYITAKGKALRYGIAVGRAGFLWSGVATITSRTHWPKWTPPPEMIERSPEKAKWKDGMPGGPENPLGARALYLTTDGVDYGYRIHGTPEWNSIGKNASSGCIRMINQDVMDLYNRVQDGAKVVVLNADGSYPDKLKLPPKPPAKKKAAPKPAATTLPAEALPTVNLPAITLPTDPAATVAAPATPAVVAPAVTTPAVTALAVTVPAVPAPAVTVPAATAPTATVPAVTAPTATATAAPATTLITNPCAVPLVNGLCPKQ